MGFVKPTYYPMQAWVDNYDPYFADPNWANTVYNRLLKEVEWVNVKQARGEYFMYSDHIFGVQMTGETYTYGVPPHDETYVSGRWHPDVKDIMDILNECVEEYGVASNYNVCFLNRYDNERNQLGWHSDDSPGMLHEHPIAVVSFGEPREIWVREKGASGVVPKEDRYLLEDGSLFIMPPGYQKTHQHRIPKGGKAMGPRVSLTFRRYVP